MTYYHHVDDSGDPGLSESPMSSSHFVLAMVQLAERGPLPELAAVRQALHLEPTFEFKFHKTKPRQRAVFFEAARAVSFRVRVAVVHKARLAPTYAALTGPALTVEFLTRLTMRASDMEIASDILVVDGATPAFLRALRVKLSEACRASRRVRPFKKIVGGRSSREDGLQLADMLAGAARQRALGLPPDYYALLADKVADWWDAPDEGE